MEGFLYLIFGLLLGGFFHVSIQLTYMRIPPRLGTKEMFGGDLLNVSKVLIPCHGEIFTMKTSHQYEFEQFQLQLLLGS